tara:strand:- start:76 stop:276 length:201 start_codon:yes stop_codon:yes gene_type:complete
VSDIYIAERTLKILRERVKSQEDHLCYGACKTLEQFTSARAVLKELQAVLDDVKSALKKVEYEDID